MIPNNNETEQVDEVPIEAWIYQITFTIQKGIDGGVVKRKLAELDKSVKVLSCSEQILVNDV